MNRSTLPWSSGSLRSRIYYCHHSICLYCVVSLVIFSGSQPYSPVLVLCRCWYLTFVLTCQAKEKLYTLVTHVAVTTFKGTQTENVEE